VFHASSASAVTLGSERNIEIYIGRDLHPDIGREITQINKGRLLRHHGYKKILSLIQISVKRKYHNKCQ